MNLFQKLENKYGRYAIRNLMLYLIILYVFGLILDYVNPQFYWKYLSLDMSKIFAGEVWRLVTYIIYPPTTSIIWFLLECFILYMLGNTLERLWGSFYFNLYIFIGLLALDLAALLVYLIGHAVLTPVSGSLYMSLLLAIGLTIPDTTFYLYMIIPVKAKYLMIFYGVIIIWQLISGDWASRIALIASLVNFIIFFTLIRKPVTRVRQQIRYAEFQRRMKEKEAQREHPYARTGGGMARHRCAVCGRTELDDPNLEFRYCSKCTGGKEYCLEHLYTHVHN